MDSSYGLRRRSARRASLGACLLVFLTAVTQAGQASAPSGAALIPAADLQADAAILRQAYETLHPGLYRYRSKAEVDAAFARLGRIFPATARWPRPTWPSRG